MFTISFLLLGAICAAVLFGAALLMLVLRQ